MHVTFLLAVLDACVRKLEPADYSLPTTRKPVSVKPDVTKGPDRQPEPAPTKIKLSTEGELQQGEMAFPTWAFGVLVGAVVVLVVAVAALGARLCCARVRRLRRRRDSTTDEKGAEARSAFERARPPRPAARAAAGWRLPSSLFPTRRMLPFSERTVRHYNRT